MKKNCYYITVIALLSLFLTTSCSKDEDEKEPIQVNFSSLTANGSATESTTMLTLTFDKDIAELTAADITLTAGTTGATKGILTAKTKGVYELAVSGITAAGEATVAVAKAGYTIAPASAKVNVLYVTPTNEVAFSSLTANGSATEITSMLTLTFDKEIAGLTAEDITLTAGTTGAIKGELTAKGAGVYELGVKDVTVSGDVTASVTKEGFTFTPSSQTVAVWYTPTITNKDMIAAIEKASNKKFTKDANGNVSIAANKDLIEGITKLDVSSKQLTNLEGVEYFTKLTELHCNNNKLTKLDVTKNTELTVLNCPLNQLTSLDVSNNTKLIQLMCFSNQLTSLDVSKNTNLSGLKCNENRLTTLDVRTLTKLGPWISGYFQCNLQTSDGTTPQNITLTITQYQKDSSRCVVGWKNEDKNTDVILDVK